MMYYQYGPVWVYAVFVWFWNAKARLGTSPLLNGPKRWGSAAGREAFVCQDLLDLFDASEATYLSDLRKAYRTGRSR